MLVIRGLKKEDAKLVADLIKKSPISYGGKSDSNAPLNWAVNVYNSRLKNKRFTNTKYLEKIIKHPSNKKDFLIVEDNNKIIGVVKKSRGGNFANLCLNEKYYRQGVQNLLMESVEKSCLRKVGRQTLVKIPPSPIPVLRKPINIKPVKNFSPLGTQKFIPKTFRHQ